MNNRRSKRWTIMVVSELGQIRSLHISKPLLVILLGLGALVPGLTLFSVLSWSTIFSKNQALDNEVNRLKAEQSALVAGRDRLMARLAILEGAADMKPEKSNNDFSPQEPAETPEQPAAEAPRPAQANTAAEIDRAQADTAEEAPGEAPEDVPGKASGEASGETSEEAQEELDDQADDAHLLAEVSVEDLQIWPVPGHQAIRYRLSVKSLNPGGSKVQGHVFVVLKPEDGFSEPARCSPWSPLEAGVPTAFKRGRRFSIARSLEIHGSFPGIYAVERFHTATVYVYSPDGALLVETVYSVQEVLRS